MHTRAPGYICTQDKCLKCILKEAYWTEESVIEGEEVGMIVTGENCDLLTILFTIKAGDKEATTNNGVFIDGIAKSYWKVNILEENDTGIYYIGALIEDPKTTITSSNQLRVGKIQDRDRDGIGDHVDCNDINKTIGECQGCAVCSQSQELSNNTGGCIESSINTCTVVECPPLGICGSGNCSNDEMAIFPKVEDSSCIVEKDIGTCILKRCDPIGCTKDTLCLVDTDLDNIPDSQDKCPNTNLPDQNVYGYPIPIAKNFDIIANISEEYLDSVEDFFIGRKNKGRVLYKGHKLRIYERKETTCEPLDLDGNLRVEIGHVEIVSANIPYLNISAEITFYNISYVNPIILKDNKTCTDCKVIGYENNTLVVNVSSFSLYKVIGSAVYNVQEGTYCGDSICNNQESCGTCSVDCGACPSSSGGDGGGGGGGSSEGTKTYVCTKKWECNDWSACVDEKQSRICTLVSVREYEQNVTCPSVSKPPISSQSCVSLTKLENTSSIPPITIPPKQIQQLEQQEQVIEQPPLYSPAIKPKLRYGLVIGGVLLLLALVSSIVILWKLKKKNPRLNIKELESYIKKMRFRGISDAKIRESLLKVGWDNDVIGKVMRKRII